MCIFGGKVPKYLECEPEAAVIYVALGYIEELQEKSLKCIRARH